MSPLSRRRLGVVAAVAAIFSVVAGAMPATATAQFKLTRVAGSDRYATASAIAADAFPGSTATAMIARGDQFADALAGAYLGGVQSAPMLLTETQSVPAPTRSRLSTMGAKTVILLGGTNAISPAVEQDLDTTYDVSRIAGTNRYDTAAKVAQSANAAGVGTLNSKKTAIVASGEQFPDALAAGPIAYAGRFPILLTRTASLPTETRQALSALGITHVVIAGGTAAVSSAVQTEIQGLGATTMRVAGTSRYATATALADFGARNVAGWSTTDVDLATGENFADALAGGPAAGRAKRSILLTTTAALSPETRTWLESKAATLTGGRVLGGTSAVSDTTKTAAETAGGAANSASSGQVTAADTANKRYTFVPTGAKAAEVVTYKAGDTFTVDGQSATIAAFESSITPADTITFTQAGGVTKHALVNVDASKISSGTIGNIDGLLDQFDFINDVTGTVLRPDVSFAPTGATYKVAGTALTGDTAAAAFESNLSEGDTLVITGTELALTNVTVSGTPNTITKTAGPVPPARTTFKIGNLGDDPSASPGASDDVYVADASDTFRTPGQTATIEYSKFSTDLSTGDTVTYTRVSGTETYTLTNAAPTTQAGQAVDGITTAGNLAPGDTADGGSFTMATTTGSQAVTYTSAAKFLVNGVLSTEEELESKYTAGDAVGYRPADAATNTTEQVELTDADLSGRITSINTADTAVPGAADPANSYVVLASNGVTELKTVVYGTASDVYSLNGGPATLAEFEKELELVKAGTKTGTVLVRSSASQTEHRLTTTA